MDSNKKKALIILGMHKSGASVLGGCFDLLGLSPENMLSDSCQNEQYTPNHAFMVQHEILLKELGCRWDMVGNLPREWEKGKAASAVAERISDIIDRHFAKSRFVSVNDPRMCRLMPMWLSILEKKDIKPCFVLLVRHPYEVARSLEATKGINLLNGHLLWLMHNREALSACRGQDYVIITYDALLADPIYCMEKISNKLGIDFARQPRQAYSNLIGFVRSDLKHHHGGSRENSDQRFSRYEWLYNQLRINQTPGVEHGKAGGDINDRVGEREIEIDEFPLVTAMAPGKGKTDAAYITEVFDDLLAVVSRCEQNALNSETERERLLVEADHKEEILYARVYFPEPGDGERNYTPENSRKILVAPEIWQKISIFLPDPDVLKQGSVRIDPLNTSGTVNISAINLVNPSNGEMVRAILGENDFSQCVIEGQILCAASPEESVTLYVTGKDARILLPLLSDLPKVPLSIEIWIKVSHSLNQLISTWNEREDKFEQMEAQVEALTRKIEAQQTANDEQVFEMVQQLGETRQEILKKQEAVEDYHSRLLESERRVDDIWKKVTEQDERVVLYSSELAEAKRNFAELYVWFVRLADLLGFDETTASSSLHLVKKSSKIFSRKAPIDEIQAVFRNFYSMMPDIDASIEDEEEEEED